MNDDKALIIYKASAGSGKTYTLTREYLRLLLEGWYEDHVSKHDRILAATFTNKATIELRERIIRELINIRDGKDGNLGTVILNGWREQQQITQDEYKRRSSTMSEAANELLRRILEDYGAFRVQTIDSFFQEVVRSFALEISSLAGAYNIELEQRDFIKMSLDQLFIRLGEEDKGDIFKLLAHIYSLDAESGEEKKNIRQQLVSLTSKFLESESADKLEDARELYSESNVSEIRSHLREVIASTQSTINEYRSTFAEKLNSIKAEYNIDLEESSRRMLSTLYKRLSDEAEFFKSHIEKGDPILNATLTKVIEDDTPVFYAKSKHKAGSPVVETYAAATPSLVELLTSIASFGEQELQEIRIDYLTAGLILKYIDLMPLLFEAKRAVEEYQREQNIVLISRINTLLRDIIDGASVPFIYDKVGTRIEHFMIDEFQDTSRLQWENFEPLLEESLANGKQNYLVGDVKQSIYRFRGTDSSLLGDKVVRLPQAQVHALDTNWRSHEAVVGFNNRFFEGIYSGLQYLEEDIPAVESHRAVYAEDVSQKSHHAGGGYVSLQFVQKSGVSKSYLDDEVKDEVLALIRELQDDYHFHRRDIALLVRSNSDANMVAAWLTEASATDTENRDKYNFISDEALNIAGSPTVLLLTQFISYIAYNRIESKRIELEVYLRIFLNQTESATPLEAVMDQLDDPANQGKGLYETVANVINILPHIPETEMVYVNAFMDHLFAFSSKNTATFQLFESWWERTKDSLKVEMGDLAQDSITIITIHKSKGLEFPVVIMPNADWKISKSVGGGIDLFETTDAVMEKFGAYLPYYYLDSAPSSNNLNTHFRAQYLSGMEADYMDNLNLLYVAFTRAAEHLYVSAGVSKSGKTPIKDTGDFIHQRTQDIFSDFDPSSAQFSFGTRTPSTVREKEMTETKELSTLTANPRYDHLEFTTDRYQSKEMQEGTILHRIMENTRTAADFRSAIRQAVQSDWIDEERARDIEENFEQIIKENATVASWFTPSDDRIILSEISISEGPDTALHRPDRLILQPSTHTVTVVDYKFGAHQSKYIHQVSGYMSALHTMGYHTIGYLWYNLSADPDDLIRIQSNE